MNARLRKHDKKIEFSGPGISLTIEARQMLQRHRRQLLQMVGELERLLDKAQSAESRVDECRNVVALAGKFDESSSNTE